MYVRIQKVLQNRSTSNPDVEVYHDVIDYDRNEQKDVQYVFADVIRLCVVRVDQAAKHEPR